MNLFKIHNHQQFQILYNYQTATLHSPHKTPLKRLNLLPFSLKTPSFKLLCVSRSEASIFHDSAKQEVGLSYEGQEIDGSSTNLTEFEDLAPNGDVYRNTLRLVECSMFAAVTGLVYFLSNSLSIENYFGCFFSLPVVISSLRWGAAAGRKTVVATTMLLFVLAGPVKALVYVLTHGLVGFTMGALWRSKADWRLSILVCTIVRSLGAVGYVLTSSFLIRENILALITINIHASLTYIFAATGINIIPSMNAIYTIFGTLVLLNCGSFVFLLHLLYSVFLTRLGMRDSLRLPRWLEKAL